MNPRSQNSQGPTIGSSRTTTGMATGQEVVLEAGLLLLSTKDVPCNGFSRLTAPSICTISGKVAELLLHFLVYEYTPIQSHSGCFDKPFFPWLK